MGNHLLIKNAVYVALRIHDRLSFEPLRREVTGILCSNPHYEIDRIGRNELRAALVDLVEAGKVREKKVNTRRVFSLPANQESNDV